MMSRGVIDDLFNLLTTDRELNLPFELDQDDKNLLYKLNSNISKHQNQIAKVEKKKVNVLRRAAWKSGFAAKKLPNLKSKSGNPFIIWDVASFKIAITIRSENFPSEVAYLCQYKYDWLNKKGDACGWVKGRPREEKYNELGPLAGSSGVDYYCVICGKNIGRAELMHS